jgi:hypothetical protein
MRRAFRWLAVAAPLAALAAVFAATTNAKIVATSGDAKLIAPPPSVVEGALESSEFIHVFDERQCTTLAADLHVDITQPGMYGPNEPVVLTPGVIPAGTVVSSHFMHSDEVGEQHPPTTLEGTITTDADILGVIVTAPNLNASDAPLGAPGTIYPTGLFGRHIEFENNRPDDWVGVELIDPRTVTMHTVVRLHVDQVRVVTKCAEQLGNQGCTPGYWKQSQHFDSWQVYSPNQTYASVFGVNTFGSKTLLQVLSTGGGGANALGRISVAALLNAVHTGVAYPLTSTQVINQTKAALQSGNRSTIESLKNQLDSFNNGGCPLN